MQPEKLGNVWVFCRVQVIDGTHWRTVAAVPWTPRHVADAMHTAGLPAAWVLDPTGERTYTTAREVTR